MQDRSIATSNPGSSTAASTASASHKALSSVVPLIRTDAFVSVVTLPDGYGLMPITLSVAQVGGWTGLKKTKIQELINTGAIVTSKVDGRTLCLTSSVIALIERNRVERVR